MPIPASLKNKRFVAGLVTGLVGAFITLVVVLAADEMRTSRHQAAWLSDIAARQRFDLQPGPTDAVRYPGDGPFDVRLGYASLPTHVQRLVAQGYEVTEQARMSPAMMSLADRGIYTVYPEKTRAGLSLRDCRAEAMYRQRFPERVFDRFEAAPDALVKALLFVENRELLQPDEPTQNPAVEWDRFARAAWDQAIRRFDDSHPAPGGSTLATQIEKYRHSPDGRTDSPGEKLRQMATASLRAYSLGQDTRARRRQIVLDYLNTVPLAAQSGFGEVIGIGDGLWAWYGRDFDDVSALLALADKGLQQDNGAAALAFKQALSLIIAQRRPSYYLGDGAGDLGALTDSHLRLLAASGVISARLRDTALPLTLQLLPRAPARSSVSYIERKAANSLRTRLSAMLEMPRAYDLDRLDLAVDSSLDARLQRAATRALADLRTAEGARAAGLYGFHLLNDGDDPSHLAVSFTLYERGSTHRQLRAQTDNMDQPFDLNEGARLDLGSTAKLRTLVTYLELVAELHARLGPMTRPQLQALTVPPRDRLTAWARDQLLAHPQADLPAMLEAAMQRKYSASPGEVFFTGGGQHTFENFEPEDNGRILTVHEALQRSVNLVFIRLMREVVQHLIHTAPGAPATMLDDADDPRRREYLARFADKEGRQFLARFHARYRGLSPDQVQQMVLERVRDSAQQLAAVYPVLQPGGDALAWAAWLDAQMLPTAPRGRLGPQALFDRFGPGAMSLEDRAYVAGVHPLDLWLAGYLQAHPGAGFPEVVKASVDVRQQVYGWLFKTRAKRGQDVRIASLLEQEAFAEVLRRWRRLGYPFDDLTPSYATALGASGDRPAALAELMGIIVNEGLRLPQSRVAALRFAAGTPYEVQLRQRAEPAERVLPAAVTRAARKALIDVVENGTARRLKDALKLPDGSVVPLGGKTGTGDHRFDTYGRNGQVIASRVVDRSATLVFLIGDRYWGTVMVYVHEPYAASYKFTSALPAQLLKSLAPVLNDLLARPPCQPGPVAATTAAALGGTLQPARGP